MSNTHAVPDTLAETMAREGDLLPAVILSAPGLVVPPSSMTLGPFSAVAYVVHGTHLKYVTQPAASITLTGADGNYWLGIHADTHTAVAAWTRVPGTHYLWRGSPTQPPGVDGLLGMASVTVAGGVITAVTPNPLSWSLPVAWRTLLQLGTMALQNATAIAVTGGSAEQLTNLSGTHVGAGMLASGSFALAVTGAQSFTGGNMTHTGSIQAVTLEATNTVQAAHIGAGVAPNPTHALDVNGITSFTGGNMTHTGSIQSVTFEATNTIQGAHIGAGVAPNPAHALDVNGVASFFGGDMTHSARITAQDFTANGSVTTPALSVTGALTGGTITTPRLTVNGALVGNQRLTLLYPKAGEFGLVIKPTDTDAGGGAPVIFSNLAGATVGSIQTTATATAFNTSSDRRLKEAITALPDALTTLRALQPVTFLWKADGSPGVGFVADEVQAVVPQAVSGPPDGPQMQGVDFSKLVPYLVASLQEVVQRLEALEARLA